jgi:hypothetical protein
VWCLDKSAAEGITLPDGSDTEESDGDESQSHQDPSDPSESLGGNELVAVDKTASTTVSSTESSRVYSSSNEPEEPADCKYGSKFLYTNDLRDGEPDTVRCDRDEEWTSVDEEESEVSGGEDYCPPRDEK